ncbi:unnamed protein product [Peniophora sp. CBMAI 1063]|nr:unnamed protein product [Peniophora sp. CBMAI 1063]
MAAVDPTYPLYPVACVLASTMLLLVLLTSIIRQSWNLGLAILCFWLFVENLTGAINAIIWSDNADIKLYVYCDIVSHVQLIASVVKPMATLIITRRLYLVLSLQSVDLPDKAATRRNLVIEWTLGLVIPLLVAGPFYYIVQWPRFVVFEGFGCSNATDGSILSFLLIFSFKVIAPLISTLFYLPHIARIFYRQSRDMDLFNHSNDSSVSRTIYYRILALASVDILLTLPIGVVSIALNTAISLSSGPVPFYPGWTYDHTDWEPVAFTYADLLAQGTSTMAQNYFIQWTSPVLAFVVFGLFGVTAEARASYWRIVCAVGGWFGWKPTPRRRTRSTLGEIEFGERLPQDVTLSVLGSMSLPSSKPDLGWKPSSPSSSLYRVAGAQEPNVGANEAETHSRKDVLEGTDDLLSQEYLSSQRPNEAV